MGATDLETAKNVKVVNANDISVNIGVTKDTLSGGLLTIDNAHHEIHEGNTFHVSYKSPDASPIADNGTLIFVLTTTSKVAHLIFDSASGGDSEEELREDVTITDGTAITPQNKNRTHQNNSVTTVVRDPTVTDAGLLLDDAFIPGGSGPQATGGIGPERDEWELKPNAKYMIRLTNRSGSNQPMALRAEWYEE